MKILSVGNYNCQNQNKSCKRENVNFGSMWVNMEDAISLNVICPDAECLIDKALYEKHYRGIGKKIIKFVQMIQENHIQQGSLNYSSLIPVKPHLFLVPKEQRVLFEAMDSAEKEIIHSDMPCFAIDEKWEDPKSSCGKLRDVVEQLLIGGKPVTTENMEPFLNAANAQKQTFASLYGGFI